MPPPPPPLQFQSTGTLDLMYAFDWKSVYVFIIYHAAKGRLKSVNSYAVIMLRHAVYTHCCAKFQNWASGNMKEAQSLPKDTFSRKKSGSFGAYSINIMLERGILK